MEIKMNDYTQEQKDMIAVASDLYDLGSTDKSIAIGLTQGDGWWGSVLATGIYESPRVDLAADFHDFCHANSLDQNDVANAEHFLKQLKLEQKINKMKKDFE